MTFLLLRGSSNTDQAERIKKLCDSIETAVEKREKFVVIEHPETGFFIQFALQQRDEEIILDVPLVELSDEQVDNLKELLKSDVAMDPLTGEPVSIQKTFHRHEIRKASGLVEEIFLKIFDLSKEYNLMVEIFS